MSRDKNDFLKLTKNSGICGRVSKHIYIMYKKIEYEKKRGGRVQ
jgi:hypothetical protein